MKGKFFIKCIFIISFCVLKAQEYHVSKKGDDANEGTFPRPFKTISAAALIAKPGDTITVHEGVYRERITPKRGGKNDLNRIVYRAAKGEKVVVKGSELIRNWELAEGTVWKVVLPNTLFGSYNPYSDLIEGDWYNDKGINHHTGEVFLNGKSLYERNTLQEVKDSDPYEDALDKEASTRTWFSKVDEHNTVIWANFQGADPNKEQVEISVRPTCFYPDRPNVNFITVRGFVMEQAATQWAAPTAEQIGLIGTHWSKGWIIEDNTISNSKCVGITLGKDRGTGHNVWSGNTRKGGATHYNEVIFRALEIGWSKETIGSHQVRNNTIYDCGQAGIVGSLGAVFSRITGNHIYDIWTKRTFDGAEMGGIKIHAAIDVLISNNRIHDTGRGIWIDWMAQGSRITKNILYNNTTDDLFTEVNHGPNLVDHNLFLSKTSLKDWSQGGAYAHNLFSGRIVFGAITKRYTPYHLPHSTKVAGLSNIPGGDNRFFNNIFIKQDYDNSDVNRDRIDAIFYGLHGYENTEYRNFAQGNLYYNGALPYEEEVDFTEFPEVKPIVELKEEEGEVRLYFNVKKVPEKYVSSKVTTDVLGMTVISEAIYENTDGNPISLDRDFFGTQRRAENPMPGPFKNLSKGKNVYLISQIK